MSSFLDPPELRNRVYEYLGSDLTEERFKHIRIVDGTIISHPLARTCRQLRTECTPIFDPYHLREYNTIESIEAVVQDFKFEGFRRLLERVVDVQQRQRWSYGNAKLPLVHITVELTAPAKDDLDGLRSWLRRHKDARMRAVQLRYTVIFNCQRYDVRWANVVCSETRKMTSPVPGFAVPGEGCSLREAMETAVNRLTWELKRSRE
ncbi:hypothetical protein LTR36_001599 [Oleoguttula mirabilis]|uniref:Uncharacterized protein n=1 Tax=Oleoguttula mirabilis TaxID=1507867 RepID=A0AAV9JMU3_9PEZI|nr:hypothetical protein LTR36_001599 [Oleoguttula mirabilis]